MISTRGPKDIPVLDRNAVPLRDICASLIVQNEFTTIENRYAITRDEILYCAQSFVDNYGPEPQDFIEMNVHEDEDGDINVDTAGVSDWVFLEILLLGERLSPTTDANIMFVNGLKSIMHSCLTDIKNDLADYEASFIHNLVFDSFRQSFGEVTKDNIDTLLYTLDSKPS